MAERKRLLARYLGLLVFGIAIIVFAGACVWSQSGHGARDEVRNFIRPPEASDEEARAVFRRGRELFAKRWTAEEGLGPLFDGQSCLICHPRGGGGRPVLAGRSSAENASMVVRLQATASAYGRQLQRRAGGDVMGEGEVAISYVETDFIFPDGEVVRMRTPRYTFAELAHDTFPEAFSVVIAPKVAGVGLLEAVPEANIRKGADPDDHNSDGISGRIALTDDGRVGRFGWRAESATVAEQVARAFALDMGLSTPLSPDPNADCTAAACRQVFGAKAAPHVEVGARQFADLVAFARMMKPPPQGSHNSATRRGEALFSTMGCASCHHPSFDTEATTEPYLSRRRIWPYTDLLLHDMGEGLADRVSGEWRTAPLWGVALRRQVQREEFYLHDGRARSLVEAILWHGGEANRARDNFSKLSREERSALLAFLETL
ncbi:MAG: di-heme oxidoredictase family protein [Sphingorhabdus sp.]